MTCARHEPAEPLEAEFVTCDVRDAGQVEAMVGKVAAAFGRLDVVVNNAGGTPYAPADGMSPLLAERVIASRPTGSCRPRRREA